jgi:cation diffusion facilitator CzcD-associated flavoprotein CzcO
VTDPIERITPRGVLLAGGEERPADVLVCATGYEANRFLSVIDVIGRDGVLLADAWAEGPRAFKGIAMSGFPNLFMLYGPNTNTGSILGMLELEVGYVLAKLRRMEREDLAWIDVRREVLDAYNETLQRDIAAVEAWQTVGSRYYRAESGRIVTQFPGNMAAYAATLGVPDEDAYAVGIREPARS